MSSPERREERDAALLGAEVLPGPSPELNEVVRFALARAQNMTGVRVHGWVAMSNHIHLVVTDVYGERPRFMELFDAERAKAASSASGDGVDSGSRAARLHARKPRQLLPRSPRSTLARFDLGESAFR